MLLFRDWTRYLTLTEVGIFKGLIKVILTKIVADRDLIAVVNLNKNKICNRRKGMTHIVIITVDKVRKLTNVNYRVHIQRKIQETEFATTFIKN